MVTIIYMPLLNEGTSVWRPVEAEPLGRRLYRVIAEAPDDEEWEFPTGTVVVVDDGNRIVSSMEP